MIHTRQLFSGLNIREGGDGRTLVGALMPWGVPAQVADRGRLVTEVFERGAFAGNDPAAVPLTARHPRDAETLPIGRTLEIDERADAAWAPGTSPRPPSATRSWSWPATASPRPLRRLHGSTRRVPLVTRPPPSCPHPGRPRPRRRGPRRCIPGRGSGRDSGRGRRAGRGPARHPGPPLAVTMASKNHINVGQGNGRSGPASCLGCHRPIVYGDRCPPCQRKLRQRRKRKPR
jgi:hypothetical protein